MKMEQTVFLNVGIQNSDAGELPRKKHATFRTWQKFEIKKINLVMFFQYLAKTSEVESLVIL